MALFTRIKNIIISPKLEWQAIKSEESSVLRLFKNYAMLLALIPSVAGVIGYSIFGISYGFGTYMLSLGTSISWFVVSYVVSLGSVYVLAIVIDALSVNFGSTRNMVESLKIVIYSYTIVWVVGVLSVFQGLGIIILLSSFYSVYTLYLGLQIVKEVPKDKILGFIITVVLLTIVITLIGASFSSSILAGGTFLEEVIK